MTKQAPSNIDTTASGPVDPSLRTTVVDINVSDHDRNIMEDTRFIGQPMALLYIFSLEFWERFSFYGLQAILAIYIYFSVTDGGLGLPSAVALGIVAAYGGSVYLSTLLGGWVSDRLLGAERTIFYSAIIVVIGHATLALFSGVAGLMIALVLTALGAGGVKANAAAMVGMLYSKGSQRRDSGFVIYYMSITIGALLGPLLTGLAQSELGFHYGFGLAAIGMTIGLVVYSFTNRNLPDVAKVVSNPLPRRQRWNLLIAVVAGIGVIAVIVLTGLLTLENVSHWISIVSLALLVMFYVVFATSRKVTPLERKRTFSFIPALISTVVYFALHFQVFGLLTNYADTSMNRNLGGWEMPVAWLITMYAVIITICAPFLSILWSKLRHKQPSSSMKMGIGLPLTGLAFLMFIPFANASEPNSTPVLWVALILFLISVGELLIGPVGVSMATTVAPAAFKAQTIGVYYLSLALGSALSGVLSQYYDSANQTPYWVTMGALGIVAGVFQIVVARPITRSLARA